MATHTRRLHQIDDGSNSTTGAGNDSDDSTFALPPGWDDASLLFYPQPTRVRNTIVVLMAPDSSSNSSDVLRDMLDLVSQIVNEAFVPMAPPAVSPAAYRQRQVALEAGGGEVEADCYGLTPEEEAALLLTSSDDDKDAFNDPAAGEEYDDLPADSALTIQRRRRRMLSQQQLRPVSEFSTLKESEAEYDIDAAYAEDDAWVWQAEEADELSSSALTHGSLDQALFGYAVGSKGSDAGIMELVVSLTAPVEDGGIPPALLHLLADPESSSVAELLDLIASQPSLGTITIQSDTSTQGSTHQEMPRFAVFGSSAVTPAEHAAAGSAKVASAVPEQSARVSDMIVAPLSGAAKAPTPHTANDAPSGMDARWWGVALSLGAVGLLLVGVSIATMKM